jgi:DNA gyrase subunit B
LKGKILNVEKARFDKMLGSAEIGTLIKALGCGIGSDEFSPESLRYHSIIIMTDADVDGSHIRTLLLTFFFRQMRELVEAGHIFIAQPPLYKIRKGKQEQYLKDDFELTIYQTQSALEGASLHVNPQAPGIMGDALEALVNQYNNVYSIIGRLARLYPTEILEAMVFTRALLDDELRSIDNISEWVGLVNNNLTNLHPGASAHYKLVVTEDLEQHIYLPKIEMSMHGLEKSFVFKREFFKSGEYAALTDLGETLEGLIEQGGFVKRGEKTKEINNFAEAIEWLLQDAMKGHYLQRYKGLGEMNPDQLWDTTMNPETRRMLQVTIEDAISADQLFNTLMGDQVEPRREFIETNALAVENLDV